jgi:hypothetical protein
MIMNLGSLYLVLLLMIVQVIILTLTKPLTAISRRYARQHLKLSNTLYWNAFLRLILEATLDFSIAALINIETILDLQRDGKDDWWQPELPFFWLNYLTVLFAVVVILIGPIFVLFYYTCRYHKWQLKSFENRFGAVLDGLRKNNRVIIFYPVFFMIRRIVFAVQAVF